MKVYLYANGNTRLFIESATITEVFALEDRINESGLFHEELEVELALQSISFQTDINGNLQCQFNFEDTTE